MIITNSFSGDGNEKLKQIQHDLYSDVLYLLLHHARDRYLRAARLLGVDSDLVEQVVHLKTFDHRVLQDAHDRIAAHYRFAIDPRGQMPLPVDDITYEDVLRRDWQAFFAQETARLSEDDEIVVAILTAVGYENSPQGLAAEDKLLALLNDRYPALDGRSDLC